MNGSIEIKIPSSSLEKQLQVILNKHGLDFSDNLDGKTIGIDEFRKKYACGKARPWVRHFIFDKYPETNFKNGGFVVNPRKTKAGRTTFIFEKQAARWMQAHDHEIDWNARLPK